MFGIGLPEMLFILVVALVVLGPEQLPKVARQIARFMGEIKRAGEEFKQHMDIEGVKDLKGGPEEWERDIAGAKIPDKSVDSGPGGLGAGWRPASGHGKGIAEASATKPQEASPRQDEAVPAKDEAVALKEKKEKEDGS